MAVGQTLRLRLFLEGVEVPVISATVNVVKNAPASATVQIIATDRALEFLPRTVVHLFFYDFYAEQNPIVNSTDGPADDLVANSRSDRYKLFFMGEITTVQFQKRFGQRAVILQCLDFSNYWDTTFQYNFGGEIFTGRRKASFMGANANLFNSILGHGTGHISRLVSGRSVNFPELRGLLAGIVRLLEAIGGAYLGRNTFRGANDFSSIAELRLKINQQITASEKDTSSAKLFAHKSMNQWLNQTTQSLGKIVTFRGLVNVLFKFIFHEVYPCPLAKYVPAASSKTSSVATVPLDSGKTKFIVDGVRSALSDFNSAMFKLQGGITTDLEAAVGSRVLPEGERAIIGRTLIANVRKEAKDKLRAAARTMRDVAGRTTKLGGLSDIASSCATASKLLFDSANKVDTTPPSVFKVTPPSTPALSAGGPFLGAETILLKLLGKKIKRRRTVEKIQTERVNNQIFRPEVFFVSPPRCNILFPELYSTFDWGRQYLREVSRLQLETSNELIGRDALFNGYYFAPNVEGVREGLKLSSKKFARLIMEHELFTGIIPMFEHLAEANIYAVRSKTVNVKGAKVSYAQRAVNFQYFKYRFGSRSMSCTGKFNPYFVPGFPGVILDRYMNAEQLRLATTELRNAEEELGFEANTLKNRAELLEKLVPTQYHGLCETLSHSLNQEGGSTQYNLSSARIHREDTEFIGIDKHTVLKNVGAGFRTSKVSSLSSGGTGFTFERGVRVPTAGAAIFLKKGQLGPRGGKITKIVDITDSLKNRSLPSWPPPSRTYDPSKPISMGNFPSGGTFRVSGSVRSPTLIPTAGGTTGRGSLKVGSTVTFSSGSGTETYNVVGLEITEELTKRVKEGVRIPIEDAIRPPWFSDIWSTPKIGEVYDQFFSTSALTDVEGFSPPEGGFKSSTTTGASTAAADSSRSTSAIASGTGNPSSGNPLDLDTNTLSNFASEEGVAVEAAVDFLVQAYSVIKQNHLDVNDFLRAYTWRPIATMTEILGSDDLNIEEVKTPKKVTVNKKIITAAPTAAAGPGLIAPDEFVYKTKAVTKTITKTGYVATSGTEGFHSRAFGDVEDLFGLVSPQVTRILGLDKDGRRETAAKLDVRKRRRDRVRAYISELANPGLIG